MVRYKRSGEGLLELSAVGLSRRKLLITGLSAGICGLAGFPRLSSAEMLTVPAGEERFTARNNPGAQCFVIEATHVHLTPALVPAGVDLIVRADEILIDGPIELHGHHLTLLARMLTCSAGASVDTSGLVGYPSYTDQVAAESKDGRSAESGTKGGDIDILVDGFAGSLLIHAGGGRGGDAESGGDGSTGAVGSPADRDHAGGVGGQGLQGGLVGTPGDGGNGGAIRIAVATGFNASLFHPDQSGGDPGTPGHHGKPGKGGSGGPAFQWTYIHQYPCVN